MSKQYSADHIIELEFLDAVRKRPGMYIGNNNLHGLHHILLEVLDNSVDECMAGYASKITVVIEKDGTIEITDDGRGIPVDFKTDVGMSTLTQVLVKPHAGGKFGGDDSAYSSSGGLHGIGLKCTNAFSSFLEVEVHRHGLIFYQRFEDGGLPITPVEIYTRAIKPGKKAGEINKETKLVLTGKKELAKSLEVNHMQLAVDADPEQITGTIFRFRPNRTWFSREMEWPNPINSVPWDADRLSTRFRQIAHLYPGVRIEFLDKRTNDGEPEIFFSKRGLVEYIEYLNEGEEPLHKPIMFKDTIEVDVEGGKGTIEVDVALQYAGEDTQIYSFVNAIPTPTGGTHVSAFKAGLTKAVKQFATNKKLLKGNMDVRGDDALLGLTAIIKLTMTSTPQFLSQTKESLTSPEVHGPVLSTTYSFLNDYLDKNVPVGKVIVNQAVASARGREAAAQARKLVIKKSAMDAGEFVLGKLADIQRRGGNPMVPLEHTALYLVEGDSAGGSCKQGRDSRYHAILSLRGKIPNVEKMKLNDILKNREIAAIIAAVGTGVGADCDVSSMRYGRVSVLVDADVDGSHIATLLATLFWRTMRSVIEEGRFFVARPPLYLIKNKSGKESRYAYSEQDREDIEKEFGGARTVSVQRYKGLGEMNPDQLRETVFVLPDEISEKKKKPRGKTKEVAGPGERELTAADFSSRDLRMVIDDFHRTRSLITRLMGSEVAPRKEWLMNVDWSAED